MKSIYLFLFFGLLLFAACNTAPVNNQAPQSSAVMPFTDTLKADTFKVELIANNSIQFTITSYLGVQIYKTNINAAELLKSSDAAQSLKSEAKKLKFLQDEVKYFFEEEHFLIPAVMDNEKPDQNVPDKAFYEELKLSKLNGFSYRSGKDSKTYIAWSVKVQKVMSYYQIP